MTSPSSRVRLKTSRQRFRISPEQREKLTNLLVEGVPRAFDQILQGLSHSQLLLLIVCLILLFRPLLVSRPAIWQQGVVGALLIAIGHFILKMEESKPHKKTSEYIHLFLIVLSKIGRAHV